VCCRSKLTTGIAFSTGKFQEHFKITFSDNTPQKYINKNNKGSKTMDQSYKILGAYLVA
jgi:hypothetical protein